MGDFVKTARTADIPAGTGKVFNVGGTPVAVFNAGGKFHAIHNVCVHRGGPLGEGELDGTAVTCPWHGWVYDVTTGESSTRAGARVACFEVKVEGEEIFVKT